MDWRAYLLGACGIVVGCRQPPSDAQLASVGSAGSSAGSTEIPTQTPVTAGSPAGAQRVEGMMPAAAGGMMAIAVAGRGGAGSAAPAASSAAGMAALGGNAGASGKIALQPTAAGSEASRMPVASAGCGKSKRPSDGLVTVSGSHIYWFPPSYDGVKPMPLIMAFHAAGNGNDQLRRITAGSALEQHFVMAFPKSSGNGWSVTADASRIDARYDDLLASYCIDTSRVFAIGHSSGAQLIVQLMCKNDDRFFAIAPVASSTYCERWGRAVPAIVIHGANDKERAKTNQDADGKRDLSPYLLSNACSDASEAYAQPGCASAGTQVDPGCREYSRCAEPTVWCHHNDPEYSGTNHGWPCFANSAIDAFFSDLL